MAHFARLLGAGAATGLVLCLAPAAPAAAAGASYSTFVYATREGLVGHTTANGHKVAPDDHFAALPSWRTLATRDSGDFSVRVCSAVSHRCAYEPVWDVGPWNTHDDYWSARREQWGDLPRGRPQAQAAHEAGYHAGHDQFGRPVRNPAGIDLADGAINQDLGVRGGSAWVTVTYLWTGAGTNAQVRTARDPVNLRGRPSVHAPSVGAAARFARIPVTCSVAGDRVSGSVRSTNTWLRLAPGQYVSYAYIGLDTGTHPPNC